MITIFGRIGRVHSKYGILGAFPHRWSGSIACEFFSVSYISYFNHTTPLNFTYVESSVYRSMCLWHRLLSVQQVAFYLQKWMDKNKCMDSFSCSSLHSFRDWFAEIVSLSSRGIVFLPFFLSSSLKRSGKNQHFSEFQLSFHTRIETNHL